MAKTGETEAQKHFGEAAKAHGTAADRKADAKKGSTSAQAHAASAGPKPADKSSPKR